MTYRYRLRLAAGVTPVRWEQAARAAFPDAGWELRDFSRATPDLQRLIDRVALFLSLVGLSALLVGGLGIGNAVRGHIAAKTATIATLKCLGAPTRLVFAVYFCEIMALALAAICAALALGALLPIAAAPLLSHLLPVSARLGIYPQPLTLAGALRAADDARLCAVAARRGGTAFPPAPCSATLSTMPAAGLRARRLAGTALLALCLAGVVIGGTPDRHVAIWFVAGGDRRLCAVLGRRDRDRRPRRAGSAARADRYCAWRWPICTAPAPRPRKSSCRSASA